MGITRSEHVTTYHAVLAPRVTLANIAEAKQRAKVSNAAVMLNCSYLGLMTLEEFQG